MRGRRTGRPHPARQRHCGQRWRAESRRACRTLSVRFRRKSDRSGLIETGKWERAPELSPDGRWLAYNSWASGRSEVYVRPYPGEGATRQVSVDGGSNPAWNPANGRELFYIKANGSRMMVVEFGPGSPPRIGLPRTLFEFDARELDFLSAPVRGYDVSPDGQRFYVIRMTSPSPPPAVTHINLILNWFEELQAKVPR